MKAEKGNREYFIDESQKKLYQDRGFDIKNDEGTVIAYGRGKTVSYDEYEKMKTRNKELVGQVKELQEALDAMEKPKKGSSSDSGENGKKG